MAGSTDIRRHLSRDASNEEKTAQSPQADRLSIRSSSSKTGDHTERRLKSRHIQLIGIGGTIGTALYVSIGRGLLQGGPASLFLAFSLWYVNPTSLSLLAGSVTVVQMLTCTTRTQVHRYLVCNNVYGRNGGLIPW